MIYGRMYGRSINFMMSTPVYVVPQNPAPSRTLAGKKILSSFKVPRVERELVVVGGEGAPPEFC